MAKRVFGFCRRLALTAVALGTMPATLSARPLAYSPMAAASQAALVGAMAPVGGAGMDLGAAAGAPGGESERAENPCNPCAPTNPCNPCAPKNPCNPCAPANPCNPCAPANPCNPCGAPMNPCNPCAPKNPCNPCGAPMNPCNPCAPKYMGMALGDKDLAKLMARGEELWNSTELSTNGLSCQACHMQGMSMTPADAFPHYVAMPDRVVSLDQMINFCLINPMAASPFGWDDERLTALAAHYTYGIAGAEMPAPRQPANPCAANPCNPCGAPSNPCGAPMNPCNPCAPQNPCDGAGHADAGGGRGAVPGLLALVAAMLFAGVRRVRP